MWSVGRGVSFLQKEGLGRDTADDDGDDDEFSVSKWRIVVHSGAVLQSSYVCNRRA